MAETTEQYRNRINQLKTGIENEPYIEKIRENIAEGISKTGNRQADIEVRQDKLKADIEFRQDKLEDDFATVQQDASSASPSGAEVAVARAGFNTLDERLTTKEQEVTSQMKKQSFLFGPKPWFIGRRGCSMYAPESSRKSFELAYFNGMDGIETDLRSTADGHIICYHDATLDTKTNGTGKPEEVTLEYIQSLKLTKANGYDAYPNTGIATFDEYLDVAKKYNLIIFPEIAVQTEAQVYEITDKIIAHGLENQCVVLVNRWNHNIVKTHAPNLIRCLIPNGGASNTADIDFCAENGIEICGAAFSAGVTAVPQSFIDYANEKGVYLNGYIINTASDFIRIKNLGFKFITTDVFGEVR